MRASIKKFLFDPPAGGSDRFLLLLILVVCAGIYAPAAWNGFTYDDRLYVMAQTPEGPNVMVQDLKPFSEYFKRPYGYPMSKYTRGFRPVTVYTFALTHNAFSQDSAAQGGGSDPAWPHHVLNILLHLLGVWLVYRMVAAFTGPGAPPLLAALVFGVHALRSDAVISIVGRGELLGFVFGASAILVHLRGLAGPTWRNWRIPLAALLLFLAFASKESAVVWAVFLPLYSLVVALRTDSEASILAVCRRQALAAFLVVGPPLLLFFLARNAMLLEYGRQFAVTYNANPLYHGDAGQRVLTGIVLLGYGLWKVLAPLGLSCDYGVYVFRIAESWTDPRFLGALAALLVVTAGGLAVFRRHPLLFASMAVFLGFAFLTSNIPVPIETIFGERLLYTPALGLSLAAAWAAGRIPRGGLRQGFWFAAALWCLVCGAQCVKRSFDWHDNETLYLADVETQPRSLFLNLQAASIRHRKGDRFGRERFMATARRLDPDAPAISIARGMFLLEERNLVEAEKCFRGALGSPLLDEADTQYLHHNLGILSLSLGRREEARQYFETAMTSRPATTVGRLARVALLWYAYEDNNVEAMNKLLDEGEKGLEGLDLQAEQKSTEATYAMFRGLIEYRQGRFKAAVNLLGRSLSILETKELNPERIPAVLAYVDALRKVGEAKSALAMVRGYLNSPRLPAEHRPKFEELLRALEQ